MIVNFIVFRRELLFSNLMQLFLEYYSENSQKRKKLDKLLAIALASTNIAYDVIKREEMRELFEELDPFYPLPSRRTLGRRVDTLYEGMMERLKVYIIDILVFFFQNLFF